MTVITYRLSWEVVDLDKMHLYMNADPRFYKNCTKLVSNADIPDEHWHKVVKVKETKEEDMTGQYETLKKWADEDTDFIRNVKLEKAVLTEPIWEEVE